MKRFFCIAISLFLFSASFIELSAEVRLPAIISDGMVIQRESAIDIWGWADDNEEVTVVWRGRKYRAVAQGGKWTVEIKAGKAGGPFVMTVNDKEVKDILVGDVYLCSGQSNMELPVRRVTDMFADEIAAYENEDIRYFHIPNTPVFDSPAEDVDAAWKHLNQENVMNFSALSYFFGKALYEKTGVPVGLVNASVGGTPIEAWMSESALEAHPRYLNEKKIYESEDYRRAIKRLEGQNFHRWNTALDSGDPGLTGEQKWYSPDLDDNCWRKVNMFAGDWGNNGLNPIGGSHWFRQNVMLPEGWEGREAVIRMGCIVDADSVYVNGVFVGNTTYQYPPRIYRIPAGVLKGGVNNVTVRVISNGGQASFVKEKPYKIICADEEVKLSETWAYHLGSPMPPAPSMMFFHYVPVVLHNGMIAPIGNFKFKGALWYQGESNVERRNEYAELLGKMMKDWRKTFEDDIPFYIIELADFLPQDDLEGRKAWAGLREAQAEAVANDGNATLIRNSDLGEWNDIHPLDKKTLAGRIVDEITNDKK